MRTHVAPVRVVLFIGPEGGWTEDELNAFARHDVIAAKLTDSILRVETAALVAAAVVAVAAVPSNRKPHI